MSETFLCEIEARGYDLDSYGHVNHAVYLSYLEHARWKMLADHGIGPNQYQEWKAWPIVARAEVRYHLPCFAGDRLQIRTTPTLRSRASFTFAQEIWREGARVFSGTVKAVCVDEKGALTRIPTGFDRIAGPAK